MPDDDFWWLRRRRRSAGGGGAPAFIVDDATSTSGYVVTFTPTSPASQTISVTLSGSPVTLVNSVFTNAALDAADFVVLNPLVWDGVSADVTPSLVLFRAGLSPLYEVSFRASGNQISSGSYTIPSLTAYADELVECVEYVTFVGNEVAPQELTATVQAEVAFTPVATVPASAAVSSASNFGTDTDSFLYAVQGIAGTITGTNQTLIFLDSLNQVLINTSGHIRVLTSDPAGANANTASYDIDPLIAGDAYTFLFAFHQGSSRITLKRNAAAFVNDTVTIPNTLKRMALPTRILSNATPGNYTRGSIFRIAAWTDIGSLVDVTSAAVQEKFVQSDGTVVNPIRSQATFGKIGNAKLRLDFYKTPFLPNRGAVTGFSLASGTLT
jgi:hypothetical protein